MRATHIPRLAATACVTLLALACGKKEEPPAVLPPPPAAVVTFKVTSVDVGKSLNADKSIANSTNDFLPRDTIYASVATEGSSPGAAVKAKWTFEDGQVVDETTQTIAPSGPARTEFHIAKPTAWPAGKYKVEITVDGALAGSKDFEVKKG